MKTRIISGVVAALLVVGLLVLNSYYNVTIVIALAILAAIAVYEMLYLTGAVKTKLPVFVAMIYAAAVLWFNFMTYFGINTKVITIVYVFFLAIFAVLKHNEFKLPQLAMAISMPIIISFAFTCLASLINVGLGFGVFLFVLLFNFACVTDIGAYFVGTFFGKHKLAPEIRPKKTVEGAVGGVACSVVGTVITCFVFQAILDVSVNILLLAVITPVFSILGMFGDLFASLIKRHFGIKDYGNIMPGHGGVLDRTDSILFIAPAFLLFLSYFSVI